MPSVIPCLRTTSRPAVPTTWVLAALLVPAGAYSILYGSDFIFRMLGYAVFGMAAEALFRLIARRPVRLFNPGSSLTAALLAASVPPGMPVPSLLMAILIALWIVKLPNTNRLFRINAAMTGRLFLMLAFPSEIAQWGIAPPDVISTATPQELYRNEGFALDWHTLLFQPVEGTWEGLFALVPGSPGETFPLVTLLIGAGLCLGRMMSWRTPFAYLATFAVATTALGNDPFFNLFSAGTMFTAVFIASDPVSTPISRGGQIACGLIMGISNALIRHMTYYTEAVVYAVLIGNLASPFLDRIAFRLKGQLLLYRLRRFQQRTEAPSDSL